MHFSRLCSAVLMYAMCLVPNLAAQLPANEEDLIRRFGSKEGFLAELMKNPCKYAPANAQCFAERVTLDDFPAEGYVLDIGGGDHATIGQIKPAQVIAIDISKMELEVATKRERERGAPGPLKIIMDAADLKFLDETFNTVTAWYSLLYMTEDVQTKALKEAWRVLKPGGRMLIWDAFVPVQEDPSKTRALFARTIRTPQREFPTAYGVRFPDNPHDLGYWKKMVTDAGFRIDDETHQERHFHLKLRKP